MNEEEYFDDNDNDHENDDDIVYETEIPILTVSPGENEKGSVFRDFLNMRNEASFCDVAFLVQGTLFRAHRVVVRYTHADRHILYLRSHIWKLYIYEHSSLNIPLFVYLFVV